MNPREIRDLVISALVLTVLFAGFKTSLIPYFTAPVAIALGVHYGVQAAVARRIGYEVTYRLWPAGVLIALAIGLASKVLGDTVFVFAAVGSVALTAPPLSGGGNRGLVPILASLTNTGVGLASLFTVHLLNLHGAALQIVSGTAEVNLWVALFNLLPVPPLEGWSVIRWNIGYWAVLTGIVYSLNVLV